MFNTTWHSKTKNFIFKILANLGTLTAEINYF